MKKRLVAAVMSLVLCLSNFPCYANEGEGTDPVVDAVSYDEMCEDATVDEAAVNNPEIEVEVEETLVTDTSNVLSTIPADAFVYNGHSYALYTDLFTVFQAKAYCESLGGHLLELETKKEMEAIRSFRNNKGVAETQLWIGAIRNSSDVPLGSWTWMTGATGEADVYYGKGQATYNNFTSYNVNIYPQYSSWRNYYAYLESDNLSQVYHGFICEWDTTIDQADVSFVDGKRFVLLNSEKMFSANIKAPGGFSFSEIENSISWDCKDPDIAEVTDVSYLPDSSSTSGEAIAFIKIRGKNIGRTAIVFAVNGETIGEHEIMVEPELKFSIEKDDILHVYGANTQLFSYVDTAAFDQANVNATKDFLANLKYEWVTEDPDNIYTEYKDIHIEYTKAPILILDNHRKTMLPLSLHPTEETPKDKIERACLMAESPGGQTCYAVCCNEFSKGTCQILYRQDMAGGGVTDTPHKIYYSDEFFYRDNVTYKNDLAVCSLGMELSAWSSGMSDSYYMQNSIKEAPRETNIRSYYKTLGFFNEEFHNYDVTLSDASDKVAYSFAVKRISDGTSNDYLITAVIRGGGYGAEWSSNFNVNNSGNATGFETPARTVFSSLEQYVRNFKNSDVYEEGGTIKLWITGYSRGSAVANLLTHKINYSSLGDEIGVNNIYSYGFATPNGYRKTGEDYTKDRNIFNIVSGNDIVPRLALQKWGFSKYGQTLVLPEFCSEYLKKSFAKLSPGNELLIERYGDLEDAIIDFLDLLYPDTASFAPMQKMVQKVLADLYSSNDRTGGETASVAIGSLIWSLYKYGGDKEKEAAKKVLSFTAEHFPEVAVFGGTAYVLESILHTYGRIGSAHNPEYYMSWLEGGGAKVVGSDTYANFSDSEKNTVEAVLKNLFNATSTKYTFFCPVDVYVYNQQGQEVCAIVNNQVLNNTIPCYVVGDHKSLYLPDNEQYSLKLVGNATGSMDYQVKEIGATGEAVRNVYFNDVPLTKGLSYVSTTNGQTILDSGETYQFTREDTGEKTELGFDTLSSNKTEYTITVEGGIAEKDTARKGEAVNLYLDRETYPENRYEFIRWESDSKTEIFKDATSENTRIHMPAANVHIKAVVEEIADTPIDGPVITEDVSMDAGQKVTYSCVWFGSYPQAEVVKAANDCGINPAVLESSDIIVDQALYQALLQAEFDEKNETVIDGCRYRRMKKGDAVFAKTNVKEYYTWADSETYHYFKYQPIKWRVLKKTDDSVFLLSDKALDDKLMNSSISSGNIWETSEIRSWLNGYDASFNTAGKDFSNNCFINSAFSSEEKNAIQATTVPNVHVCSPSADAGNTTVDQVFLLADYDALSAANDNFGFLFSVNATDESRRCKSTSYAKAMGTAAYINEKSSGNCCWHLRSPGSESYYSLGCDDEGSICYGYNFDAYYGVRPAIWVDLASADMTNAGSICTDGTVKENNGQEDTEPDNDYTLAIAKQPSSIKAGINAKVSFTVSAVNASSYQWQYSKNNGAKWINCSATGNTTDTISLKVTASNSVNIYRCIVTGADGEKIISETAGVQLLPGVVITMSPRSNAVAIGEYAEFTVEAENAAGYQWQYSKDGTHWYKSNAEGNQTDTLIVKGEQKSQGNRYRCVVTGIDGNTKKSYMAAMIVMTVAPKTCSAKVGETASYSLKAEGIESYQWQYSKDGGQTWYKSNAEGATTDTVTFKASSSNRTMIYRCKLTTPDEATAFTKPVGFTQ